MTKPSVVILTGAPGAGKTTVARMLAERTSLGAHIESDRFFHFIRSGYVEPWRPEAHEQNAAVMRIVGEVAVGYAAAGYAPIVDGIVIPGWFLEPLRDAIAAAGYGVAYAVLRPPLAVAVERARGSGSERAPDAAVVERLWTSFSDLGPLERHAIDIGDRPARDAADAVAARLATGTLTLVS